MKNKKGFTLVELLVAISVIAVIAAVGFTSYNAAQVRGRDAKRKQDLRAIALALEIYKQKNNQYPPTNSATNSGYISSTNTPPWLPQLDSNYINILPVDPLNNATALPSVDNNFSYAYWASNNGSAPCPSTAGQGYILFTQLENKKDPDRAETTRYKWCNNSLLAPDGSGSPDQSWSKYVFAITSW